MSAGPSIADLLEQSHRELAGTDARVYRRVGEHLQRSGEALSYLQDPPDAASSRGKALLGKGSFLKLSVAALKQLCKANGIKGYTKLKKPELAKVLERSQVEPPPPPLESFSKKELIDMVRQLMGEI